jgi:transcription initiation factor TFIIIB Brf1 subunit/transcription initiation factor TFIIB
MNSFDFKYLVRKRPTYKVIAIAISLACRRDAVPRQDGS